MENQEKLCKICSERKILITVVGDVKILYAIHALVKYY